MSKIPSDLLYTKEHEWVRLEGEEAVIGITDYAQSELGDITFVELPNAGDEVKKSDTLSTIESVKAASDIYAPVSGKIVKVNQVLQDNPERINKSPYFDGWICCISIVGAVDQESFMDADEYKRYLEESK